MAGLRSIAADMAERSNLEGDFLYDVLTLFVECVVDRINSGEEVEVTGLCSFRIRELRPITRRLPNGETRTLQPHLGGKTRIVRIHPRMGMKLRGERVMEEEGIEKYGVELDDKKKEASKDGSPVERCPWCNQKLDSGGACPDHGTEPMERRE